MFCDAVLEEAGPDDIVWVHDYHLLLLPAMLRRRRPGLKVGFFLHIPFPSYQLFRLVPDRWKRAVRGDLGLTSSGSIPTTTASTSSRASAASSAMTTKWDG